MSKAYEFIKECGVFFILSINGGAPAGRPFGAIMEYGDDLYISTSDVKNVYRQFKENEQVQIIAIKDSSRSWTPPRPQSLSSAPLKSLTAARL